MKKLHTFEDFQKGEVLLIDKPLDWTSFDVVKKIKSVIWHKFGKRYPKLKVGHAGTLDPKASGLMVICTGKATKRIEEFQAGKKEYIARLKLGATTPSFDLEEEEDLHYPADHIDTALIKSVIPRFIGEIDQVPPVFSAIRINGRRAFNFAREGKEIELKARKITIDEIEIINFDSPILELRIVCSKGTYIRSLARDLGTALNSGAYLTGLKRTRIGDFSIEQAIDVEKFKNIIDSM